MNEKNLELIRDIKVNVHVRLGHCNLPMQEIVSLEPGTLIRRKIERFSKPLCK